MHRNISRVAAAELNHPHSANVGLPPRVGTPPMCPRVRKGDGLLADLAIQMGFYIHTCVKMRYKASFQPTYILDPESLRWTLFDDDHRKQLDTTSYYSVSRASNEDASPSKLVASAIENTLQEPKNDSKNKDHASTASSPRPADQIPDMEVDVDESSEPDTEIPEGSLFDKNMPGVLTKEEVESLDLDHWKLRVRNTFVDLEVSIRTTF